MINYLKIENYQGHKSSQLEFDKGINVIIGQSDSGKSAIMRALLWTITNKPAGDSFRSLWGGDTSTEIICDGHTKVERIRTDKINKYVIDGSVELTALGQNVPDEITQALKFEDVNIQKQMDSPFLLSETSGEVARYLNKIVNIDKIDVAITEAEKQKRACNKSIDSLYLSIEEYEKELVDYNFLEAFKNDIDEAESVLNELNSLKESEKDLSYVIAQISKCNESLYNNDEALKAEADIIEAERIESAISGLQSELHILKSTIISVEGSKLQMEEIKKTISKLEKEIKEAGPEICPTCGQVIQ